MKFGRVALADALGAILAHGVRFPKGAFKKGRTLSVDDLAALQAAGVETVVAARLEPDDIAEDAAATRVAAAMAGPHVSASAAFTGRVNLYAECAGVAVIDRERLDRVNLVDEALTVATLPPYALVKAREMVATIKIIPFSVPAAVAEQILAIAAEAGPIVRIAPLQAKRVALVQTTLAGIKASVLEKTAAVTRARIEALGSTLMTERRIAHDEAAIAETLTELGAAGADLILIAGASAIVDRRDLVPAGIAAAGGSVLHYGMPVDPGNLILIGRLGSAPVIGLPGCARSPKFNGFDWVLQRYLADVPVTRRDVMLMGAGGLLSEIPSRPLPRAEVETEGGGPRAPRIAAIVLAAGRSVRMGQANKLLATVEGRVMVRQAVDTALGSQARPVIVVTGHEGERVRAALAGLDVRFAHNPDYATGLASSLKAGLAVVPGDSDGALVLLGDMPRVRTHHIERLIAAFNPIEGRAICVPTVNGKQGNPVLWARRFFPDMAGLGGDMGAKSLIATYSEAMAEVAMADDGVLIDVDTPEALAAVANRVRDA